jgi:hypothetical protein
VCRVCAGGFSPRIQVINDSAKLASLNPAAFWLARRGTASRVGSPNKVRDTEAVGVCCASRPGDERDDSVIGIGADHSYHRAFDYSRNQSPPVHAGRFCFILIKLAQAELRAGVPIKAVIGPDTDGGFSIFSLRKVQWQRS